MENSPLKIALKQLGLSEKEANVYLNALELGRSTVSTITRKAGINRTTGYDILNKLINMGLITLSGKEPRQEYVAEDPEKIIAWLEETIKKSQRALKHAKEIVPELKSIQNVGKRPQVKYYEGKAGLEQIYEDTLTSSETILAYASVEDMHNTLPDYFPQYYKRRAKKKIHIKGILPDTPLARERQKLNVAEERTSVLVPINKYSFSPEINIYDNKVMIASWKEKLGIVIESQEIADAMKKIYDLAWIGAKKVAENNKEQK